MWCRCSSLAQVHRILLMLTHSIDTVAMAMATCTFVQYITIPIPLTPYPLSLCREKALEVRRLQLLGLLPRPEDFRPARNAQYPHHTVLRCTLACSTL